MATDFRRILDSDVLTIAGYRCSDISETGSGSATLFFFYCVSGFTRHLGPVHSVSYGNLFVTATTPTASTHSQSCHPLIPSLLIPLIPSHSFSALHSLQLIPDSLLHSHPAIHCHMGTFSLRQQRLQHPLIPSLLIHSFAVLSSTHSLSLIPDSLLLSHPAIHCHMGTFSLQQQHQQDTKDTDTGWYLTNYQVYPVLEYPWYTV